MVIKIKDKEIEPKRLNYTQAETHAKYLRKQIMDEAKGYMVGLPLKLCESVWDKTWAKVQKIQVGTDEYAVRCCNADAMAHALWLAVSPEIKDFGISDAMSVIVADADNITRAIAFDVLGLRLKE